jgi:hypothetical protein
MTHPSRPTAAREVRQGQYSHTDQLTRIHKTLIIHALLRLVDRADRCLGELTALLRFVEAVVDVGYVLDLYGKADRMRAGKKRSRKGLCFAEGEGRVR